MRAAPPEVWDEPVTRRALRDTETPEDDACAICGVSINDTVNGRTTAHWDGPWGVTIVAWTCGDRCAFAYEMTRAIG
jgi:hypothetical protein